MRSNPNIVSSSTVLFDISTVYGRHLLLSTLFIKPYKEALTICKTCDTFYPEPILVSDEEKHSLKKSYRGKKCEKPEEEE